MVRLALDFHAVHNENDIRTNVQCVWEYSILLYRNAVLTIAIFYCNINRLCITWFPFMPCHVKLTLVECWHRVTFINCKINQKTQEKTHSMQSYGNWMINFLARTGVCSGLPGGYCCVLYPLLVIHHMGTVSATVPQSHMQREKERMWAGPANNKSYLQ